MHELARSTYLAANRRVIHNYVLAEFVALASARRLPRIPSLGFVTDLLDSPDIEVFWVSEPLHREAMLLLHRRRDKAYSLCDAVSFVLMRRSGIADALTTDQHFEQEGFRRLLVPG
jgi:predicted nucleic acid-binding protein